MNREKVLLASIFSFTIGCELYVISDVPTTQTQFIALFISSVISLLSLLLLGFPFTGYLKKRITGMFELEHALLAATIIAGIHFGSFLWLLYELVTRNILPVVYAVIASQLIPCVFIILFAIIIS